MMSRLRVAGAALAVALLGMAVMAPPAAAAESKSVQVVGQQGRTIDFLVYLDPNIATAADGDLASSVVIAGTEVPSTPTPILESSAPNEAILVLDVSGSMRGPRLAAAQEAAINYVRGLPADVEIGLVTFNDSVSLVVKPTADKQQVIDAIAGLEAGKKTALYDGLIAGLSAASPDKTPRLVLLSDGGDTVSAATIDDVRAQATDRGVPIDIVALTPTTEHATSLKTLSTPTNGQYILATDLTGLNDAFDEATGSFGGKVAVQATVPETVDASGKFAIVTVTVDGTDYTGTTQLPSDPALGATTATTPVPVPTAGTDTSVTVQQVQGATSSYTWLLAILAAVIVIVVALAVASYRRQQKSRLRVEQVLWYSSAVQTGVAGRRPEYRSGGALDNLDAWMAQQSWYPRIDNKLDNAGLGLNVATWILIRIAVTLVLALLCAVLIGNVWVGLLIGALVGWLLSGAWLNSRESKARKDFETELPDFLLLMASSLRAGLSFQQALDSSAAEGTGQVSRQMRRAMSEVQMGSGLEPALLRVADRMENEDLRWTVAALQIQREVGGNLSNILETAALTVKGRAELRREVRTLSAEGRLSGWVLAALPVGLFFYMVWANPSYISFFWTYSLGFALLGFMLVLFILGFIWMRRIVKIEV